MEAWRIHDIPFGEAPKLQYSKPNIGILPKLGPHRKTFSRILLTPTLIGRPVSIVVLNLLQNLQAASLRLIDYVDFSGLTEQTTQTLQL